MKKNWIIAIIIIVILVVLIIGTIGIFLAKTVLWATILSWFNSIRQNKIQPDIN